MAGAAALACSSLASLALVPAGAGTSAAPPPIGLTAAPARVLIEGSGNAAVRVSNYGATAVVVDVARAGFSLDMRGRPRVLQRGDGRTAVGWIAMRPRKLVLRPRETRAVTVAATPSPRAEPGDHDALLLLTTRPRRRGSVAVRMRVGVVVVVRVPGKIVHRLELRALRLTRVAARARTLELLVLNRGNVTEQLRPIHASFERGGRVDRTSLPRPRQLRPHTRGILQLVYRGSLRGAVAVRVRVGLGAGGVVTRTFRLRL